ncbi:hypothetical protein, partial [Vibrio parahaemolyticus]|uniref:hypothetical protein n=1 Tax=Vibrio parahaemolyticus TaxID=670 RepID=UPI001E6501C9
LGIGWKFDDTDFLKVHWLYLLCIGSTALFAQKLRMVVFLFLAFLTVLPALLQERFKPTY